jgi:hypothetical protein
MSSITLFSPSPQDNVVINDILRQLNDNTSTSCDDSQSSSANITNEQLSVLLRCFKQQQDMITTMMQTINSPLSGQHAGTPVTQAR